ncbi:MAG: hypothetical protein AABY22_05285 [Nanoarchaeota archaeon]
MVEEQGEEIKMENDEIHNAFEDRELRDFISKTLRINKVYDRTEEINIKIRELNNELKKAKIQEALLLLLKKLSWQLYDVSDDVLYNKDTYFDFIGTLEEYETVFKKENE